MKNPPKIIVLDISPQDLGGAFRNTTDCPLFRCAKRNGIRVSGVGVDEILISDAQWLDSIIAKLNEPFIIDDYNKVKAGKTVFRTITLTEEQCALMHL